MLTDRSRRFSFSSLLDLLFFVRARADARARLFERRAEFEASQKYAGARIKDNARRLQIAREVRHLDALSAEASDVSQRAVVARMGALLGPSLGGSGPSDTRSRMRARRPSLTGATPDHAQKKQDQKKKGTRPHSTYKRIMERVAAATGLRDLAQFNEAYFSQRERLASLTALREERRAAIGPVAAHTAPFCSRGSIRRWFF